MGYLSLVRFQAALKGTTLLPQPLVSPALCMLCRLWLQRPLPEQLVEYAVTDVRHLLAIMARLQADMLRLWPLGLLECLHSRFKLMARFEPPA